MTRAKLGRSEDQQLQEGSEEKVVKSSWSWCSTVVLQVERICALIVNKLYDDVL